MMQRWLRQAFIRIPQALDPLIEVGRRYAVPVLRPMLPAVRLVGRTTTGETARVLAVDRRFAASRLCRLLFAGEPAVEWSGAVPLTGLRRFVERERRDVDLVLATIPDALPALLRPAHGISLPGLVELVLPVMADREAQYRLAHLKRRNRLRRCERAGYGWRVGSQPGQIRQFLDCYHRPHVTEKFGLDLVARETFVLERHARHGGVLWLLHDGKVIGGDLFHRDHDRLWLMVTGLAPDLPVTVPTPQEALCLLATDLARERGCAIVSFGAAAPLLREGLMQFKLSLGAQACVSAQSHRDLVVDWERPTPALHALLRAYPLIVRRPRGFAALTSTVGVDPSAHLGLTSKFLPRGITPLLALSTDADTVEAATAAIAAPDDDGLPLDDGGPGMIRP